MRMSNPLALAILAQLCERPMHPYEIAAQMRSRGIEINIKLNYGSLYSVVEVLRREGLIVPRETVREGRLPERTVYAVTAEGRAAFFSWLRDLLRTPVKEYTRFAAGLSFIAHLSPTEAATLLEDRARVLAEQLHDRRSSLDSFLRQGLDRLFVVEEEHGLILLEAELAWVRRLVGEIRDGTLTEVVDGTLIWKLKLAFIGMDADGMPIWKSDPERVDGGAEQREEEGSK